jgi:drug/metabolite transporter (DMT)-like permease
MVLVKGHRPVWYYYLILFVGIVCIGWSAIFVKLSGISGLSSAFYRMFIGFLGILPLWIIRRRSITDWPSVKIAIVSGLIFACDIAVWNISIMLSKAAISTLLANLAPVWVGIGSILFLKERPSKVFWIGTAVSLFGVAVIVGIDKITGSKLDAGHFLAILASIFYAIYLLFMRKGRVALDTVTFTAISMLVSSVFLLLICLVSSTPLVGFSLKSWVSLAGLGLISQLGGWLAINYALGFIESTTASVGLLSQTVFTAIIAVPLLNEKLSLIEICGALVVLFGIYLVTRKAFLPSKPVEPEY